MQNIAAARNNVLSGGLCDGEGNSAAGFFWSMQADALVRLRSRGHLPDQYSVCKRRSAEQLTILV